MLEREPQSLEQLQKRTKDTEIALVRLAVIPSELGETSTPSFMGGVNLSRGFERLNRNNFDILPPERRLSRRVAIASVKEKISIKSIPVLEARKNELAEQITQENTAIENLINQSPSVIEARRQLLEIERLAEATYATNEDVAAAKEDVQRIKENIRAELAKKPQSQQLAKQPVLPTTKTSFGFTEERFPVPENFDRIKNSPQVKDFLKKSSSRLRQTIEHFLAGETANTVLSFLTHEQSLTLEEENEHNKMIGGAIFADIAFEHLKTVYQQEGTTVLSPYEVFLIFRNLFSDDINPTINDANLDLGIDGISLPDGLIIRESENSLVVDGILEYKFIKNPNGHLSKILAQSQYFTPGQMAKDLGIQPAIFDPKLLSSLFHTLRPELPEKPITVAAGARLIYGIPENSDVIVPGAENKYVPITTFAVNALVSVLREAIQAAQVNPAELEQETLLAKAEDLRPYMDLGVIDPKWQEWIDQKVGEIRERINS